MTRVLDHIHILPDLMPAPNVRDALVFSNSFAPMVGSSPPPKRAHITSTPPDDRPSRVDHQPRRATI